MRKRYRCTVCERKCEVEANIEEIDVWPMFCIFKLERVKYEEVRK